MKVPSRYLYASLLTLLCLMGMFAVPVVTHAATDAPFELFPGETAGANDYRIYIQNFYRFSIAAGILIATVLIMIGGVMWTTSAGNHSRIDKAKDYITDSIIGVILLIGAYTILAVINPNLVNLPALTFKTFGKVGACITTTKDPSDSTKTIDDCQEVAATLCDPKTAPAGATVAPQGEGTKCADVCKINPTTHKCESAPQTLSKSGISLQGRATFCAQFTTSGQGADSRIGADAGRFDFWQSCPIYCKGRPAYTDDAGNTSTCDGSYNQSTDRCVCS